MEKVLRFLVILFLIVLATILPGLQGATPQVSAQTISVASLRKPGNTPDPAKENGTRGLHRGNVKLEPRGGPVLTRAQNAPALPVNDCVSALPNNGLDNYISAFAVSGGNLYVAGFFTQTFDGAVKNLNKIARFDGTNWSALPNQGLDGVVNALAVVGSDLYVGGQFSKTADGAVTHLNNIAKFDGTSWSALPHEGLNQTVYALAASFPPGGGVASLYVGGDFTGTADGAVTGLNGIAKFKSTTWSALPNNGLNDYVSTLAVSGKDLYVGGGFTQTNDATVTNLNYIAKFRKGTWSALPNHGLDNEVYTLAVSSPRGAGTPIVYAGGSFTKTGDGTLLLNRVAEFSGGGWSALPHGGLDDEVYTLAVSGNNLYAGGAFFESTDGAVTNMNNIAKFGASNWSVLPHNGMNDQVYSMALKGGDLYVGGPFTGTGDGVVSNLNAIAKFPKPGKPSLKSPPNNANLGTARPTLEWNAANCTDTYQVIVKNAATGQTVDKKVGLAVLKYKTKPLTAATKFQWFVQACNSFGCVTSAARTFSTP